MKWVLHDQINLGKASINEVELLSLPCESVHYKLPEENMEYIINIFSSEILFSLDMIDWKAEH